ncbi:MAG: hypothetical protein AAF399_00220 [Bacteroidota bacterium]
MNAKVEITISHVSDAIDELTTALELSKEERLQACQTALDSLKETPLYHHSPAFLCGRMFEAWGGIKDAVSDLEIMIQTPDEKIDKANLVKMLIPGLAASLEYLLISDREYQERRQTVWENFLSKCEVFTLIGHKV